MSGKITRPDIILVRHAQSAGNVGIRTKNTAEIPLTKEGHSQAEVLANEIIERFGVDTISRIIVTTYLRTHQTAAYLVESTGLEPEVMSTMREITYLQSSKADGKTFEERRELRDRFWEATKQDPNYTDSGEQSVDSAHSFLMRIHHSLDELAKSTNNDSKLQVLYAHEYSIAAALRIAIGDSDDDIIAAMVEHQKPVPTIENTQAVGLSRQGVSWIIAHPSHSDLFKDSRKMPR